MIRGNNGGRCHGKDEFARGRKERGQHSCLWDALAQCIDQLDSMGERRDNICQVGRVFRGSTITSTMLLIVQ